MKIFNRHNVSGNHFYEVYKNLGLFYYSVYTVDRLGYTFSLYKRTGFRKCEFVEFVRIEDNGDKYNELSKDK